jgi:uncharacterized membrane protein (UPF0136 family)
MKRSAGFVGLGLTVGGAIGSMIDNVAVAVVLGLDFGSVFGAARARRSQPREASNKSGGVVD